MTVKRMDNVGIVVEDIDAAIEFFTELGPESSRRLWSPITAAPR
jgi:catechol 2,3-dioxygenase-like lactoylglutathione lyase family enzyme